MVMSELLSELEIFRTLPDKISQAVEEQAEIAPYAPGEVVVTAGQPFTFFGLMQCLSYPRRWSFLFAIMYY